MAVVEEVGGQAAAAAAWALRAGRREHQPHPPLGGERQQELPVSAAAGPYGPLGGNGWQEQQDQQQRLQQLPVSAAATRL